MPSKFSKSAKTLLGIKAGGDDAPAPLNTEMKASSDFNALVNEATEAELAAWIVDVEGDEDGFVEGADYYELCDAGEQVLREYIDERRSIFEPEIGKLKTYQDHMEQFPVQAIKAEETESHYAFMKRTKPARPCEARDMTFGGRCLNCGYDPDPESTKRIHEAEKEIHDVHGIKVKAEGEVVGPVQQTALADPGKPKPGQKIDPKTGKPFAEVLQTAMDDQLKNSPKGPGLA